MTPQVYKSEDGFTIRGGSPPGLKDHPEAALLYWGWFLEFALRAKDRDLSMGLDKDGKPMRAVTAETRKHRHSEMTPTGRGDPSAPPLEPGRQKSRVRSLLTGKAFSDHVELWWKFDPFTGDSFARILEMQAERGRDVFGLSPRALKRVRARAWEQYGKWEKGKPVEMPRPIGIPTAAPVVAIGSTDLTYATMGINAPTDLRRWSGGLTIEEWVKHFREPARVSIPGRPGADYNVLLRHIWGAEGPPTAHPPRRAAPKPPPPAPSRATLAYGDEGWEQVARRMFGPGATARQIADLTGAPDGRLSITHGDAGELYAVVHSDRFRMTRKLKLGEGGVPTIYAAAFYVEPGHQGRGIGADAFARMVESARAAGVGRITTRAAKGPGENGYYTWARFGYDATIPADLAATLPDPLRGARRISDLMTTDEGASWWRDNGRELDMTFDLTPGGRSLAIWDAYRAARAGGSSRPTSRPPTSTRPIGRGR